MRRTPLCLTVPSAGRFVAHLGGAALVATLSAVPSVAQTPGPSAETVALNTAGGATVDVVSSVAREVADIWGVDSDRVRVDFSVDVSAPVDSLQLVTGSTDRWIVTLWTDERSVRRFARVGVVREVPVAARPLERGQRVVPEDVAYVGRTVWGEPSGTFADPVGMVAERVISAGDPLESPAVRPPVIVRGGSEVEAVLVHDRITLRVRAEALSSARLGDRIDVRLASGMRATGRVVGPGLIELTSGGS